MTDYNFFDHPILNSPYEYPARHWELDESGQPTNRILDRRRKVDLVTPIPKPKKSQGKRGATGKTSQKEFVFDEGKGLSTAQQQYEATTTVVNEIRGYVDQWRQLRNESDWLVTPETARLLRHWRTHEFERLRPFFCQVEAVETAIWLTEVASKREATRKFIAHLDAANAQANPGLSRLALKLATGAGKTTVMAMLIAWQTVNAIRHPGSKLFTKGFLVVTPGITIRDRLRVPFALLSYPGWCCC